MYVSVSRKKAGYLSKLILARNLCLLEREPTEEKRQRRKETSMRGGMDGKGHGRTLRNGLDEDLTKVIKFHIGPTWRGTLGNRSDHAIHPNSHGQSLTAVAAGLSASVVQHHVHTRTHVHIYTSAASDSIHHYRIEISYSRADTSNL